MASPFARQFQLAPGLDFLNHGAFGARPTAVLDAQDAVRRRYELDPVRFVLSELESGLDRSRAAAAELVHADPEDLVFVQNATTGVNTVLASLALAPGDEIVSTGHGYPACLNAADFWARRAGAKSVTADVPFPLAGPGDVVDAVLRAVTPRTRLVVVDHVTSPTALVLPVAELAAELRRRGVETLVDGAHALGMLPLDIPALGVDYYTGNFHKWCCAPSGAAMLWVAREHRSRVRPLVISHGAASARTDCPKWQLEFDWVGTQDPSILLALPVALETLASFLPGGLSEMMEKNRELALAARRVLLDVVGGSPACPESMLGSMAAVVLPDFPPVATKGMSPFAEPLYSTLLERYRIQVPVIGFPAAPRRLMRISAHLYNDLMQYERLAQALKVELHAERAARA